MIKNNFVRINFKAFDVNAGSSPFSVGIPAVISVSGFVDRIRHNINRLGHNLNITGFTYGYSDPKIVGHDGKYATALNAPKNTLDPEDLTPSTSPRISAKFQLILELESGEPKKQAAMLQEALSDAGLRFCGGIIDAIQGIRTGIVKSKEDLWSSFMIKDATQDIAQFQKKGDDLTLLEAMFIACHSSHGDGLRRYPNTLGYISLQDTPKIRETQYGQQLHAYVEPSVGVVKEIHTARLKEKEIEVEEILRPFVFRKHFDARGSLYLKQSD